MLAWFKRGALVLLCFIAVWLLMVVYWRNSQRMPSVSEAVLYLLVLPAAFLLCIWLLRKLFAFVASRTAKAATVAAAAAVTSPAVQADSSAAERTWHVAIMATALRSPHGASAEELTAALKSKEARLPLDAELTTLDGFPVRAGRVAALESAAVLEEMAVWQVETRQPVQSWSDEQARALAMGTEVLLELLPQLLSHPQLAAYTEGVKSGLAARKGVPLPILQLLMLWPSRWSDQARQTASMWFKHLLESHGWPAEKLELGALVANAHAEPLALLDKLLVQTRRMSTPYLCLAIACESWLGEDSIQAWDQAGGLRKAKVESGQTPGEGGVALLLADAQQVSAWAADAPIATMHRVAWGLRDKSADAGGRISGELLAQLTQDAMLSAGIAPAQISLLLTDGDHRRLTEIFSLEATALPDLDFSDQCLKVAADCGSAGAVSSLTALALAHHEAGIEQGKALCIGCQDAFERVAVVVQPFTPQSATAFVP